jgi:hypothetical protein
LLLIPLIYDFCESFHSIVLLGPQKIASGFFKMITVYV